MQFMSFYRPFAASARSGPPTAEHMAAMNALANESERAGILLDNGGLQPSAAGARVRLAHGKVTVIDGPFTGATSLIEGYAVMKLPTLAAAIDEGKQFIVVAGDGECEIRPMYALPGSTEPPRYLMMYRPDRDTETAPPPSAEHMAKMGALMTEKLRTGVLIATNGLLPSSRGALVTRVGDKITVTDGPFAESKELVAGYALLELKSLAEAIAFAPRFLALAGEGISELRAVFPR